MDKKRTGSYYTPSYLTRFISKRVFSNFNAKTSLKVLEPSVGDGAFVEAFSRFTNLDIKLTALDINQNELNKASVKWNNKESSFVKIDFLDYPFQERYSAIIGNPPYVKKNRLSTEQIELSKAIHQNEELTEASVKNIWTTFLVKANTLLTEDGIIAFVLPSELLQVKFAEEIREYLKNEFERIEIFTFNDLMFECKGQDTIVLFAYKKSQNKGEFFTNIESKESLENENFVLQSNNLLVSSKIKWTHHFLTNDELTFIEVLKKRFNNVNYYSDSKPGIVTGANKFFIVDEVIEKEFQLNDYTKSIIQKGAFVNGSVVFNNSDLEKICKNNNPTRLLELKDDDEISPMLAEYLEIGIKEGISERYKCKIRNNWYVIPNISQVPEAFFFKRSHLYPKLLKNNSNGLVTDSAYKISMRENHDLDSFIYSFYNSLTLLFSEIEGRYYGGGVLELTPNEFKKLPIPYTEISTEEFDAFTTNFKNKGTIEDILNTNDVKILHKGFSIDKESIEKIKEIRNKLIKKRLRK